jgi:phytol kinase
VNQASTPVHTDKKQKKWLGLPPSEPDSYTGPWEKQEHWALWLAAFWAGLCLAGTALSMLSSDPYISEVFAPPGKDIWVRISRQVPLTFLVVAIFGTFVERWGVNVAFTRKTFHILGTFIFPLTFVPAVLEGEELYRQWYLSVTWSSLLVFVLPFVLMVRPIRSRVRFLYLGHRCFDRPEDRPYTLLWFISQMLAIGVLLVPMAQYFAAKGVWSLYLIAATANGLGDGLAEPLGKIFGKKKYTVRALFTKRKYTRSYVGSACVGVFTALGIVLNAHVLSTGELIALLAILPALMIIIEAKSPHTWDNLFLYAGCWLVIYIVVFA